MTDEKNDAPVGDKEFEDNTVSNFEDYNDNEGGFFAGREEYDQAPVNVTVANVHGKPIPYPVRYSPHTVFDNILRHNSHSQYTGVMICGMSGTGKTTLSADGSRKLIGDDEHVWTEEGVFNIEGGCYAKVINLNPEKEPEIYNAIRFGALLENVMIDSKRRIDFNDGHITQNTRVAYPIEHIDSALIPCVTCHPKNVILLTCDAFGVLPPVSKLSKEQAMYHFINGYTAKVAGTEDGVKEPQATFSACYGEAFIVWHPMKYAEMLSQKMEKHGVDCWLVNTGWVGGKYGVGKRCDIKATKKIVEEIHNGNLKQQEYEDFGVFNLQIPKNVDGVESRILNPENCWEDKGEYKAMLEKLAKLFLENAEKYNLDDYGDCFKDIISLN